MKTPFCQIRARFVVALLLVVCAVPSRGRAAEITPEEAERVTALTKEAQTLRREGRYDEAIERLEEAIAIYPAPVLHYNLGRTLEDAGDLEGALAAYERCLATEPPEGVRRLARDARTAVRKKLDEAAPPREEEEEGEEEEATTPSEEGGGRSLFRLGLTVSEGALMYEGEAYRGKVGLELTPSLDFEWLRVDLGAAVIIEPPVAFILRPGVRFGVSVFYFRPALQFLLTPLTTSGALFGVGAEIPIGASFRLIAEFDVSLWFSAVNVVPLDGRLGLSYGF